MTLRSMNQIRPEELAESVRNVYWLDQGRIFDSVSSNVGWYGILLLVYKSCGFTLHTAKYVRLCLQLLSLLCLSAVLRRWLGARWAWLALCTMALSPTWLYFTTLQAQYGLDFQVFPIWLYLITVVQTAAPRWRIVAEFVLWSSAMLASMAYPAVVLGLPVLLVLYARALAGTADRRWRRDALVACGAFLLPLVVAFGYVHDGAELRGGLFRGGGALQSSPSTAAVRQLIGDLFIAGNSYNFDLKHVDFSGILGTTSVVFVLGAAGWVFVRERSSRLPLCLAAALLTLSCLAFLYAGAAYTGIRRATGILVAVYAAFVIVWGYLSRSTAAASVPRWGAILICALLPIHHLVAFPGNLQDMSTLSAYREKHWFAAAETPAAALAYWLARTEAGAPLMCVGPNGYPEDCHYTYREIFGAIAGSQRWNGLREGPVTAYDPKTGQVIPLSIELWKAHYLY